MAEELSFVAILLSPFEPFQDRTDMGAIPFLCVAGLPAFLAQNPGYLVRSQPLAAPGLPMQLPDPLGL